MKIYSIDIYFNRNIVSKILKVNLTFVYMLNFCIASQFDWLCHW